MTAVLLLGTLLGYVSGQAVGNLLTGQDQPGLLLEGPQRALSLLLFSLVPGVGATYFFYARGRLPATEARARAAARGGAVHGLPPSCRARRSAGSCPPASRGRSARARASGSAAGRPGTSAS